MFWNIILINYNARELDKQQNCHNKCFLPHVLNDAPIKLEK